MEELISGAEAMQQLLEEVSQEKEKLQLQLNEATIRSHDRDYWEYIYISKEGEIAKLKLNVSFTLKGMCRYNYEG